MRGKKQHSVLMDDHCVCVYVCVWAGGFKQKALFTALRKPDVPSCHNLAMSKSCVLVEGKQTVDEGRQAFCKPLFVHLKSSQGRVITTKISQRGFTCMCNFMMKLGALQCTLSSERENPLISPPFFLFLSSVITVAKWYCGFTPSSTENLIHQTSWCHPPFLSFLLVMFPPIRFLLLADRGVMLAVRELTRYSSASGQEGSRAEKHGREKSFLSVWWRSLKGRGGPRWGIGKREEKWTHWIKIS